jgi:hypothetical protein
MSFKRDIHSFQEKVYDFAIIIVYVLYFVIAFGLDDRAHLYLRRLDNFIKIYISLFLMYRFNPFREINFTELDRKLVFSAGVFVFVTTTVNKFFTRHFNKYVDEVQLKHEINKNKKKDIYS